jgi:uncharacterized protein
LSEFYTANELITTMGTGEAMVTALDEKGRPTQLVHTLIRPPLSRMDILTGNEINTRVSNSKLVKKYNREIDRESAHELLIERIEEQQQMADRQEPAKARQKSTPASRSSKQPGMFEKILKSPVTNTIAREVTRGILGVLGLKTTTTSRSRTSRRR